MTARYAGYMTKLFKQWQFSSITLPSHNSLKRGRSKIETHAAQALVEYFGQLKWHLTHCQQDATSWVELTTDFISQYGCVGGFLDESCSMKKLSGNFRAAVVKLFKENHIPIQRFSSTKRLAAFSAAKASGVGIAKQWHNPDFLLATLFNLPQSLFQQGSYNPKTSGCMSMWSPMFPFSLDQR